MIISITSIYYFAIVLKFIQIFFLYTYFNTIILGPLNNFICGPLGTITVLLLLFKLLLDLRNGVVPKIVALIVCLVTPIIYVSSMNSISEDLLWILLLIVSAKNVSPMTLAKTILYTCVLGYVITVTAAFSGIIPNDYMIMIGSRGEVIFRWFLGFIHCNILGTMTMLIFYCWLFVRYERLSILDYVGFLLLFSITFFAAHSRTSSYIMVLALLMKWLVSKNNANIRKKLLKIIMILVVAVSIFMTVFYNPGNQIMATISEAFTGRFEFANDAYRAYGITLFGQILKVTFGQYGTGDVTLVVDNSFAYMLITFGIIPSLVVLWYYFSNIEWLADTEQIAAMLILFMCFVSGISEGMVYSSNFNIGLYIIAPMQYSRIIYAKSKRNMLSLKG